MQRCRRRTVVGSSNSRNCINIQQLLKQVSAETPVDSGARLLRRLSPPCHNVRSSSGVLPTLVIDHRPRPASRAWRCSSHRRRLPLASAAEHRRWRQKQPRGTIIIAATTAVLVEERMTVGA